MEFYTLLGVLVLNLIPTPCKYNEILSIIRGRRIKDGFNWLTSQIFYAVLETLETRKIMCNSLGSHASGCVINSNFSHDSTVLELAKSMSEFPMIFHFCLKKGVSC